MANTKTGSPQTVKVDCKTGEQCLINKAYNLQVKYFEALRVHNGHQKKYGERLHMAEFVREVAKSAAKSKDLKPAEVWKNMRTTPDGGEATSYDTTWLKKDIEEMQKRFARDRDDIEARAEKLIAFITSETFQKHLVKFHDKPLDKQIIEECYKETTEVEEKDSLPKYREIDHFLAVFTTYLHESKAGRTMLENMTDNSWLQKEVAFGDMWGYIGKVKDTAETIGKVLYNFAPVLSLKVNEIIQSGKVTTIKDILRDPDLKRHFDFLDKKFNFKISEVLERKANAYAKGARQATSLLKRRKGWKKAINNWLDEKSSHYDAAYKLADDKREFAKTLDGLWFGIMLDSVSLAVSAIQLFSDLKNAKWTDITGAVNDLLGLTKTLMGAMEAQTGLKIVTPDDVFANQAKMYKNIGRALGLVGAVVGVVLSVAKVIDGFKSKDWDVVLLNATGAALSVAGGVAAFCGFSTLGGITIVLGLLLAIATTLILDAPIIDYLEDVAWGEDAVTPIKDTITEYYKKLFKISVNFYVYEYDSNKSFFRIESDVLTDGTPIYTELFDPAKKSLGKYTVFPGANKVSGRGNVEKELGGWNYPWPTHGKRIKISNPWEIWKAARRDGKTKYTLCVGVDPDGNSSMAIRKMALNDDTSFTFPEVQEPILLKATEVPPSYTNLSPGLQLVGGDYQCNITNTNGSLKKYVYTKYASGCTIKVRAVEGIVIKTQHFLIKVPVANTSPDSNGLVMTAVNVLLPKPAAGDEYGVKLTTELLDAAGESKGSDSISFDVV